MQPSRSNQKGPGKLRALFAQREFVAYFAGRQTGWMASAIEDVAIGWQVFSIRHQPLDLGIVGLILFLPQLLLALPAGIIADRLDRRTVCVAVALTNTIGSALMIGLIYRHTATLPPYYIAIAFIGISYAVGAPAQRAILASIVSGESFVRASAFTSSIAQLVAICGPALAGVLIAIATPLAFCAAVLLQIVSACGFFLLSPQPPPAPDESEPSLWRGALEGVRYIFDRKVILGAISLDLFAVLFGGATALLPAFATQILHVGPTGYGLLRAAPGLGAAIVAAFIVGRSIERRAGPLLFSCVAGFGAFTIVFGISRNVWVSAIALAMTGAFDMVSMVIRSALVQLRTPNAMRGRVNAVESVFIGASNELGAFESGTLASFAGTQASVVLGGCATLAVIALWAILFPSLRSFDRLEE
ncbi:MAG: MFS transporter [Candidatus Baltobacteraceae bacterium]